MEFCVHHIGVACPNLDKAIKIYEKLGYEIGPRQIDPIQNVEVCILSKEDTIGIELLGPVDEKSPVNNILNKMGATPYHICYSVERIDEGIAAMRGLKFLPLSRPQYSNVFDSLVCFLFNSSIGIIELIENRDYGKNWNQIKSM